MTKYPSRAERDRIDRALVDAIGEARQRGEMPTTYNLLRNLLTRSDNARIVDAKDPDIVRLACLLETLIEILCVEREEVLEKLRPDAAQPSASDAEPRSA